MVKKKGRRRVAVQSAFLLFPALWRSCQVHKADVAHKRKHTCCLALNPTYNDKQYRLLVRTQIPNQMLFKQPNSISSYLVFRSGMVSRSLSERMSANEALKTSRLDSPGSMSKISGLGNC